MIYQFFNTESDCHIIRMYLSKYFVGLRFLGIEKNEFMGVLGSKCLRFKYKDVTFKICILKEDNTLRFICGREHEPIPPMDKFIDSVYFGSSKINKVLKNLKEYLVLEIRNRNIDSLLKGA